MPGVTLELGNALEGLDRKVIPPSISYARERKRLPLRFSGERTFFAPFPSVLFLYLWKRFLGQVAEWFKALDSKSREGVSPPWVRIPPCPLSKNSEETLTGPREMAAQKAVGFSS
jgi:hypothetical protein